MGLTSKEEKFIKKLGQNIVAIRESKGIKQKQLSDILDMDDGSLRRIESGRTNPTTTTLLGIVEGLGIEFKDLFNFSKDD